MHNFGLLFLVFGLVCGSVHRLSGEEPFFESETVFEVGKGEHGHVHASCIVEYPNGDLLVVWYENGAPLPEIYYSGDRDKSDNVRTGAARKKKGKPQFDVPYVIADTFGLADNNPCLLLDRDQQLWLVRPTLLGVPQWSWGSALVRYQVSSDYLEQDQPVWKMQEILVPHLPNIKSQVMELLTPLMKQYGETSPKAIEYKTNLDRRLDEPLFSRLGWMPRAHPLVRSDGAVILPLSNENFNLAVMAITKDSGKTWEFSQPVPELGLTQPTVVEYPDGKMTAFFRNGDPRHRIKRSDSADGGLSWSAVSVTTLPHPGSGIEALVLKNGNLLMVYNDKEERPRDRLAVSLSRDRGETWIATRQVENTPGSRFDYPSIIQSRDGNIHLTYSDNLQTIKHVRFNEEWLLAK